MDEKKPTRIGIIGDTHRVPPYAFSLVLEYFKQQGVNVAVDNGDCADSIPITQETYEGLKNPDFCESVGIRPMLGQMLRQRGHRIQSEYIFREKVNSAADSGLELVVFNQGNHDQPFSIELMKKRIEKDLEKANEKKQEPRYNNIKFAFENPIIQLEDCTLVVLPGADIGGFYHVNWEREHRPDKKIPTGYNILSEKEGLIQINDYTLDDIFHHERAREYAQSLMHNLDITVLEDQIKDPNNTILISHDAVKYGSPNKPIPHAPDAEHFIGMFMPFPQSDGRIRWAKRKGFVPLGQFAMAQQQNPDLSAIPFDAYEGDMGRLVTLLERATLVRGIPQKEMVYVELNGWNCGSEFLRKWADNLGITKFVSGHYHLKNTKGIKLDGTIVEENERTTELGKNHGSWDNHEAVILTAHGDGTVSYQTVDILEDVIGHSKIQNAITPGLMLQNEGLHQAVEEINKTSAEGQDMVDIMIKYAKPDPEKMQKKKGTTLDHILHMPANPIPIEAIQRHLNPEMAVVDQFLEDEMTESGLIIPRSTIVAPTDHDLTNLTGAPKNVLGQQENNIPPEFRKKGFDPSKLRTK